MVNVTLKASKESFRIFLFTFVVKIVSCSTLAAHNMLAPFHNSLSAIKMYNKTISIRGKRFISPSSLSPKSIFFHTQIRASAKAKTKKMRDINLSFFVDFVGSNTLKKVRLMFGLFAPAGRAKTKGGKGII